MKRVSGGAYVVAPDVTIFRDPDGDFDPTTTAGGRTRDGDIWLTDEAGAPPAGDTLLDVITDWHTLLWAGGPAMTALALADASAVATWPDESGNGNDATQSTSGSRPTFRASRSTFNNKPAVDYSGSRFMSVDPFATITAPFTILAVAKLASFSASSYYLLSDGDDATNRAWTGVNGATSKWTMSDGTAAGDSTLTGDANLHCFAFEFDGASSKLHVDGTVDTVNAGTAELDGARVGAFHSGASFFWPGDIAVWGIVDRVLIAGEYDAYRAVCQTEFATP